jgi:Bcr/CflA subfamily drug resistance transporter
MLRTIFKKSFFFPIFLILYEFCTNMSNDMYLPALPQIAEDFSAAINLAQLTLTAWLAGDGAVQLFVGPLSDRFGRRPILFGGGFLFLLSTLGCSLAPSIEILIAARFIQGIGVCTMMVAGYASIHDLYEDKQAIHILAWMGSAAVIAPAIGPIFGSLILTLAGWRTIFYLLFFLAAFALIFLWFIMPESTLSYSKRALNIKNLIHSYRRILLNRTFMAAGLSFSLMYSSLFGWITVSPFLLMTFLHVTPLQFGWLQLSIFGAYIVGAQMVKPLLEKIGQEKLILFGLSLASLSGVLLICLSIFYTNKIFSFVLPMVGIALGFGFASAPLNRTTLTATTERKGAAIAIFYMTMTGLGILISLLLSLPNKNAISIAGVIATSVFLALLVNLCRISSRLQDDF